jgi:hypothetical protein
MCVSTQCSIIDPIVWARQTPLCIIIRLSFLLVSKVGS